MNLSLKLKAAVSAAAFIFVLFIGHKAAFADTISATSANWSGYIAQSGLYTGISGTWTIPTISPSSTLTSNATWIGIGGRTSGDLIQAGVYEIANSDGVTYQAWYELLPDDSTPIDLTVSPGDSLSVAIVETSQNVWNIVLTNNTTKQQFEKTVNYDSSFSSAEWIQERPLVNQVLAPLSGFTPVVFSGATAVQNSERVNLSQTNPEAVNLIDGTSQLALAVPSPLDTSGTSFSVFRTSATSSANTTPSISTVYPSATPGQSIVPPFELHRTGRRITWVFRFR